MTHGAEKELDGMSEISRLDSPDEDPEHEDG